MSNTAYWQMVGTLLIIAVFASGWLVEHVERAHRDWKTGRTLRRKREEWVRRGINAARRYTVGRAL